MEWYCQNDTRARIAYNCPYDCWYGACTTAYTTCGDRVCTGPESCGSCSQDCGTCPLGTDFGNATCSDTDGGIVFYTRGKVYSTSGSAIDNCPWELGGTLNTSGLFEWFCNAGIRTSARYNCPKGCFNGSCVGTPVTDTCSNCPGGDCGFCLQCSDGKDNDADGKIDYPADPGCSNATDNVEIYIPTLNVTIIPLTASTGPDSWYLSPDIYGDNS